MVTWPHQGSHNIKMDYYRCSICLEFVAVSIPLLLKHLGRVHQNEPNFHVVCGIDGCAKTYRVFKSLKAHLSKKHNIVTSHEENRFQDRDINDNDGVQENEFRDGINNDEQVEHFNLEREKVNLSRSNALCLLKFKEKGRVPQTVVDSFVDNATQIAQTSVDLLKSGFPNCLQNAGIDLQTVPGLGDLFDENNQISHPFTGIDKEPLQHKYYKENFNLVVSIFQPHILSF